eukprot:TRINITY_DN2065_c0_g1_i29.p1 TRINITY_DN2065_c0_g1~~TRINITY_DN2065_c0_g1_i29.p1  ORF type:complete len:150 (-),score=24.05 TRINITY_DN2065_c0_g1_i29:917-1309(-)
MSDAQQAKFQRTLKGVLQESANKICFTCSQKGPTYVLCPFDVFICTTCSGICRQFNWRVKGVSMSNFTEEEVRRLQNGGNQVGRDLWLANWSADSFPLPTSGEEQRINKFMQMCFIRGTWKKEKAPVGKH